MMPVRYGRLGAAPAADIAQAQADLAAFETTLQAALTYVQAGQWDSAVEAYKAAGSAGATVVGPEIDGLGAANVTQGYTQAAWTVNGKLATINSTPYNGTAATATDAATAQGYALSMDQGYRIALAAAHAATGVSPNPGGSPAPAPSSSGVGTAIVVGLGLAILGGLLIGSARAPHPMRRQ